jgi:hypothetical protein
VALWIGKAGVKWVPSSRLPLYVYGAPLFVYEHKHSGINNEYHWGLGVGAGARIPLGATRFALDAGVDEHTIF